VSVTQDLFSPLRLGAAIAKNRVWLAPMTNMQSHDDGTLSDEELAWLVRRARGGFGVIETCAAHVARDGQGWRGELGFFDDAQLPGLTRLAGAIHDHGALALAQIFHGGMRADPKVSGLDAWSASEVVSGDRVVRAATLEDIARVIEQFRDAAIRAHRAGFDGVELHGAHGYLFGQFLSVTQNRRTDEWGGSFENRARLLLEALRAVRSATPASFVVGVRISPEDFGQSKGLDLDESLALARMLAEQGSDFVHVSLWSFARNTTKRPTEHPLPLFREALPPECSLVTAGSIWTREDAERALELGADAIALGRAAIANPDWPLDAARPGFEPKRPPLTIAELRERDLSPAFAEYMRAWKGFVRDEL
jgi:2,4-dienoyl-CoA reductase-like NADH-dependent reductase (Old Yellow Enzyme family)